MVEQAINKILKEKEKFGKAKEAKKCPYCGNAHERVKVSKPTSFYIDKKSEEQYDEAKRYGLSLGIPESQVNFQPEAAE